MVRKNRIELKWENKLKQIQKTKKQKKDEIKSEVKSQNHSKIQSIQGIQKQNKQMQFEMSSSSLSDFSEKCSCRQQEIIVSQKQEIIGAHAEQSNEENEDQIQQNQKTKEIEQKLNNFLYRLRQPTPSLRKQQQRKIMQFLRSETDFILYISGVTGSGKTTTLLYALNTFFSNLNLSHISQASPYKLMNCLQQFKMKNNQQYLLKRVLTQCQNKQIIIIDQCDFVIDLARLIAVVRENFQRIKIILLSNLNCIKEVRVKENVDTLFFLPYSKDQLYTITSEKLGDFYEIVQKSDMVQAIRSALIKSGDYREVEKSLTEWAKKNLLNKSSDKQTGENIFGCGPKLTRYSQILQKAVKSYSVKKVVTLNTLIESKKPEQRKSKKLECRCKQTEISKIIKKCKFSSTPNQLLFYLKEWEQAGILEILPNRCHLHNRKLQFANVRLLVQLSLLQRVVSKVLREQGLL